ncbi:MAG: hypothetical protein R2762_16980 [Bryobacteraceae bacterium]
MKSPANPYVGPRAFQRGETLYGRDRELADLIDLLITERIVLLYSPSGAGKSSVIQAGLIPRMARPTQEGGFGFTVRDVIRVNAAPNPGTRNRYWASMMASLQLEAHKPLAAARSGSGTALDSSAGGESVVRVSSMALDPNPNGELLIFDQFEEVLTTDPVDVEAKRQFFRQIGDALRPQGRWALFAMREEYVASLDPYLRYIPTRLSNTFRLDLLSLDSSLDAIRRPAAEAGVPFETGAAEQIADDLRKVNVVKAGGTGQALGEFVEPVQLQVVCLRRWEDLPEGARSIPKSTQPQVGSTALADYYAATIAKAAWETGIAERTIRDWFEDHLITKLGTRGQVVKGPQESEGLANTALEALIEAHLVRSDQRLGSVWLELAHDRLIEPVRASNESWRKEKLSALQREAELWHELGRPESRLLVADPLATAEKWAAANQLKSVEEDFLAESRKAERERLAREQRRLKDIRTARILKSGSALLAGLLIAAVWLGVKAGKSRDAAVEAQAKANVALARYDLAQVPLLTDRGQPAQALAYLARALQSDPASPQARAWAAAYLSRGGLRMASRELDNESHVVEAVFSGDGNRLLTWGGGFTRVWDVRSGKLAGPKIPLASPHAALNHDGTVAILFNPDLSNDMANTHVIDIASGRELEADSRTGFPPQYLRQVLFRGAGNPQEAVVAKMEGVELWDARRLVSAPRVGGSIRFTEINARRDVVLIALNRTALAWRLTDSSGSFPRASLPAVIDQAALSPDGKHAAAVAGNKAYVWNVTSSRVRELAGSQDAVSAGFTPDGRQVVVTGKSGNSWLGLWSVDSAKASPLRWSGENEIEFHSGQPVFAGYGKGTLVLRDVFTFRPAAQVFTRGRADWALSPDGRTLANVAADRRTIALFDVSLGEAPWKEIDLDQAASLLDEMRKQGEPRPERQAMKNLLSGLIGKTSQGASPQYASKDGSRVLVLRQADGHSDEPPEVLDARTKERIAQIRLGSGQKAPEGTRYTGALSDDGRLVALADSNGLAEVFDLTLRRTIREWANWRGVVAMRFTSDGRYLVTGSSDNTARVWEMASGMAVGGPVNQAEVPATISISQDAREAVTGGRKLRVWDLYLGSGEPADGQALADLAEAAGGMRLVPESEAPRAVPFAERMELLDGFAKREVDPAVAEAATRVRSKR